MNISRFNFFFLIVIFLSIIILNEFTLKILFSHDGILEYRTINLIRIFNFFQIIFFFLFLFISSLNKFVEHQITTYSKIIYIFFKSLINVLKKKHSNFFIIICIFFFSLQIISICIKNYKNTSYFDVTKADDYDGWDFLKITKDSLIYKNNKMLVYGPVYPKISKIINQFFSEPYNLDKLTTERLTTFSLYLLNLISILIICYLISIIFTSRLKDKIFFSYILLNCFLMNQLWAKYIGFLRLDIFFTAVVGLIIFIRFKALIKKSEFLTFLSYLIGGLAYNIKFTYVIFLPGFALFELFLKKKLTYYISCLIFFILGFFIFGFPESIFYLEERILKVYKISSVVDGFTLDSTIFWLKNFIQSCFPMIIAIMIFYVFGNQTKLKLNILIFGKLLVIIVLPLIYFSKKIWQPTEHYVFPITISLIIILSYYFNSLNWLKKIKNKVQQKLNLEILRFLILIFFIILSFSNYNKFNYIASQTYNSKIVNEKNYNYVNKLAIAKNLLVDAYVPYDFSLKNVKRHKHLAYTHKIVEKYNPDILIIHNKQTEYFLDKKNKPKYSDNSFHQNYEDRYELYNKLYNKKNFIYKNKHWKLIKKDKLIIWEIKDKIN